MAEHYLHTTVSVWAVAIRDALTDYNVDVVGLFRDAGISLEDLDDPFSRIPVRSMTNLWNRAVEVTGDESFGLKVGEKTTPSTFFFLGMTLLTSENSIEAAKMSVHPSRLISSGLQYRIGRLKGFSFLEIGTKPGFPEFAPACVDAAQATIVNIGRKFLHLKSQLDKVSFRHPAPTEPKVFEEWFGCPVEFDAERNALYTKSFQNELVPFPTANSTLLSHGLEMIAVQISKLPDSSLRHRVRNEICARLASRKSADLTTIARAFAMSERKLQAALKKEGASFQSIRDWVLESRAVHLLRVEGHPVSKVASQLGFGQISSFTRAFKRWTGKSPTEYLK